MVEVTADSRSRLHVKWIGIVFYTRQRTDILTSPTRPRDGEFLLISPYSCNSRLEFAFDLRENFFEARIIRWEKERATEIDPRLFSIRPQTSDDVADIDGEKADQIFPVPEISDELFQRSVGNEQKFGAPLFPIPADPSDGHEKLMIRVSLSVTNGACPLVKEPPNDRGGTFPTNVRGQPHIHCHGYQVKIEIATGTRRLRRSERKSDITRMLQLIKSAAGQSHKL